ncbi:MAG: hypothetical protein J1E06_10785 [Acutalibacter sp.]|nr:hypothetical protein [Acutalibacter sp.]
MEKFIIMILLGAVIVILGISNIRGNISSIHWYNRRKVSENDIPKYGKCMGIGSVIVGFSLVIPAVLELAFQSDLFDYIVLIGCIIGVVIMVYGQIKYNKGIF